MPGIPPSQILNYDDTREYQGRGTQHFHAPIHVKNAQKNYEDDDEVTTKIIGKSNSYSLSNADQYPEINGVVKRAQTHHHTATR